MDTKLQYTEGIELAIPCGAAKTIYAGSLVCLDGTTRLAEAGSDSSGKIFAGVAREAVDNALGDAGDCTVTVRRRGVWLLSIAAAAQDDVGKQVFVAGPNTVALAAGVTHMIYCGTIVAVESATKVWVDIATALLQTDVATHIGDSSAAHAASAISTADAGNHFAAADNTVEKQLQALAQGPYFLTLPRFTGWTKDGQAQTITLPSVESPVPLVIKRAYVNLGTAPGSEKTLALTLNDSALVSITGDATKGAAENLSIAIAADTDLVIQASETASGAGANCDIILVASRDDGE